MSDRAQANNQQMIVYALVAIAVLLFVIVAYMIYNSSRQIPAPTASSGMSASDSAAANIAAQMPSSQTQPEEFDPKTATKLPAGMTPEKAVKAYNEDVMAKKYDEAYELLPLAQKKTYGSASAYASQINAYGITAYKIGKSQKDGDDVQIVSEQDTAQINVTYTWTYTKVGKDWYAKSRIAGGVVEE